MRYRIAIAGMLSVHAKRAVFTALSGVTGVTGAVVEMGEVLVDADASMTAEALCSAIQDIGYRVHRVSRELPMA